MDIDSKINKKVVAMKVLMLFIFVIISMGINAQGDKNKYSKFIAESRVVNYLPQYAEKHALLFKKNCILSEENQVRQFMEVIKENNAYKTKIFGSQDVEKMSETAILDLIFDSKYWQAHGQIMQILYSDKSAEIKGDFMILPNSIKDRILLEEISLESGRLGFYPEPLLHLMHLKKEMLPNGIQRPK